MQVITYSGKWLQCGSTADWSKAFELWTTQVYILAAIGCAQSIVCQDATNYAGNAHTIIKYTYHLMARELAYHLDTTFGHFEASNPFCFLHPPSRLGGVLGSDVAHLPEPSEIKLVVQGVLSRRDWRSNDMEKK